MRYLVFDTHAAAQAAVDLIDSRGRQVYASAGYTIDASGDIVGKRDGVDDPAGVTSTWGIPRQRLDGKWVVVHIENHPMADYEVSPGVVVKDFALAGITAPAEEHSDSWWPSQTPYA